MIYPLPIHDVLKQVHEAISVESRAVIVAPPGAGKTTIVPLSLLESPNVNGQIIILEPRRLAARAAASQMASLLNEKVGETVGFQIKGLNKVNKQTRIVVVTEGILIRMIQSDQSLSKVGCIIFDEFHERSIYSDLGLALSLQVAEVLRNDLKILVMSATLDVAPVSKILDTNAPVISDGRAYNVKCNYLSRPKSKDDNLWENFSELVYDAFKMTDGGILAFLPGEAEIRTVEKLLKRTLPQTALIMPLYGSLPFEQQTKILEPLENKIVRKVVLSTSIAETSLTIPGIRVVVDSGYTRRALYDPSSGMSRLITQKISKAEAEQRMGRAGRVAEGWCYRYWSASEEGAMPEFPPSEIEISDLSNFALELSLWGSELKSMKFLTEPEPARLEKAYELLYQLGATTLQNKITPHGREISKFPCHVRLAHMLTKAGKKSAIIAALLQNKDILFNEGSSDFQLRIDHFQDELKRRKIKIGLFSRIEADRKILEKLVKHETSLSIAQSLALAFPDRIGKKRDGSNSKYLLSSGKGAHLQQGDPLSKQNYIVAVDIDGDRKDTKIRLGIGISENEIRELFEEKIIWQNTCYWSTREKRLKTLRTEVLGKISLKSENWINPPFEEIASTIINAILDIGFHFSAAEEQFIARVKLGGAGFPNMEKNHLKETAKEWLKPFIKNIKTADEWKKFDCLPALQNLLSWQQLTKLDEVVPKYFVSPLGRKLPIDYTGEHPSIELRLQELFGQKSHPLVKNKPLLVTLLSPAGRPLQKTMDLPNFWKTSYLDIRKEMRGRYPKHSWPERPEYEKPTTKVKPKQ
mgnify:FL=1